MGAQKEFDTLQDLALERDIREEKERGEVSTGGDSGDDEAVHRYDVAKDDDDIMEKGERTFTGDDADESSVTEAPSTGQAAPSPERDNQSCPASPVKRKQKRVSVGSRPSRSLESSPKGNRTGKDKERGKVTSKALQIMYRKRQQMVKKRREDRERRYGTEEANNAFWKKLEEAEAR